MSPRSRESIIDIRFNDPESKLELLGGEMRKHPLPDGINVPGNVLIIDDLHVGFHIPCKLPAELLFFGIGQGTQGKGRNHARQQGCHGNQRDEFCS